METEKINWAQAFEYHETLRDFTIGIFGAYTRLASKFPNDERYAEWETLATSWGIEFKKLADLEIYDESEAEALTRSRGKILEDVLDLEKKLDEQVS